MAKNKTQGSQRGNSRRAPQYQVALPVDDLTNIRPRTQAARSPWKPKTKAQAAYKNAIETYDLIFCRGPMGTGKSFVAAAAAADALKAGQIEKIIVTRPSVEAEEEYGHLPGELEEKWEPFFAPIRKILEERLGAGAVEMYIKNGKIEIAPIGFLRGHTFKDCWVIFDEAQNATKKQMKLVLTRIGENCKMIIDGDPDEQLDIPAGDSGFDDAWNRMRGHSQVGFATFDVDDIVRSGLARDILLRYRKDYAVGQAAIDRLCAA